MRRNSPLRLLRRRERLVRIGEGNKEAVPLRVDLNAAVPRKRRPQQATVVAQHARVAVAERMQKPGRPFNVGEEKRDPARRKI
jgi:hypothetical protein